MKRCMVIMIVLFTCASCVRVDREDFEPNNCTDNCVYIEGTIHDMQTGEPLNRVKLTNIFSYVDEFPGLWSYEKEIDRYITNSEGFFSFNFSVDTFHISDSYFSILIEKENYFSKVIIVDRNTVLDSLYYASIYLVPKSVMTLSVQNRLKLDTLDELGYKFSVDKGRFIKAIDSCELVHNYNLSYGNGLSYVGKQPAIIFEKYDVPSSCPITLTFYFWDHSALREVEFLEDTFRIRKFGHVVKWYELKNPE